MKDWLVTLAEAKSAPLSPGRGSALLMEHGTMSVRFYAPKGIDPQLPHDQDEIYLVASGRGKVVAGKDESSLESRDVAPGDVIFVPAGNVHRFIDFTDDFATWVVFWGPKGGEA